MSYWETLLVIMRRWRISIPATLVALAVGVAAFLASPPTYEDESQVLFIGSPRQAGEKALVNPYLDLGSTLISTADVIRAIVSTQQVAEQLAAAGATAQYAVALDQSTPAPVLIVSSTGSDSAVTRKTTQAVIDTINTTLLEAQKKAGAPRTTWVTTTVISSLPEPKRNLTDSIRPAIVAVVGLLALTMFVLFLLEGRRQRRRDLEERPGPATATGPEPAVAPYAIRSGPVTPVEQPARPPAPQPWPVAPEPALPAPVEIRVVQPEAPRPVAPPAAQQPTYAIRPIAYQPHQPVTETTRYRSESPPTRQVPRLLPAPIPLSGSKSARPAAAPAARPDPAGSTGSNGSNRSNGSNGSAGHVNGNNGAGNGNEARNGAAKKGLNGNEPAEPPAAAWPSEDRTSWQR